MGKPIIYFSRTSLLLKDTIINNNIKLFHSKSIENTEDSIVNNGNSVSVTGLIYNAVENNEQQYPIIKLYTKAGCTLCDKVADTLNEIKQTHPHSLYAIDITDDDKQY